MPLLLTIAKKLAALNGYHMTEWTPNRNTRVQQSGSARQDISKWARTQLLSWSRELERKDPMFSRFLDLCEQYVTGPNGLRIVSGSSDVAWAARANPEWDAWQPYCDISSRFSFGQRQGLIEREVEVAGEIFIYKLYGSTNRPRIQLIPSEYVETPPDQTNNPDIVDGVQVDKFDRPTHYWVNQGTKQKPDFKPVPAEEIIHIFEPSRIGQHRGLPIIYPVIKDLIDLQQLQEFEMIAAKDASETSTVFKMASGEMSVKNLIRNRVGVNTQTPDGTATTAQREEYYQQAIGGRKLILGPGDDAQQFQSNRPSVAVQAFWDYVSARAAAGMGLPLEIIIMRSMQGTMTRAALDMANAFFRCRAAARAEAFGRIWEHVISGTRSLQVGLPADWRKIRYTPPRSINVDVGRNSAALINEYKSGFRTLEDIAGEMGKDWQEILFQRAVELKRAEEIEKQVGLTQGSLLGNPQPQPPKEGA